MKIDNNWMELQVNEMHAKDEGKFKKTKIGVIPEEWELKKISEIAGVNNDSLNVNTPNDYKFYYYDLSSVDKGKIFHPSEKITFEKAPSRAKRLFKKNDVLMSTVRPNLQGFAYVDFDADDCVCSTGFAVIRGKQKSDSLFIYHNLFSNHVTNQINKLLAGSNYPAINSKDVENLMIPFPRNIDEREKISSILSTWDKAIELKSKLIEQKKEQKKGLMQKLLTGQVRLPGFDGEWKAEKIKNISKVYRGASPRPISDSRWFDQDSKIGWVRISDVTNSKKILYKTEQYLSEEGIKKSRLVKKNSIIMSICATVGKPIITGFDVCIHDGFVVFEDVKINKDYFYYSLLRIENYWIKYGQTGSQMNLNTDIVGNEKIKFPVEYAEQKAIAELLMNVDKEIDLLESELEQLKLQKQGLMQLLLTGKVRVKV